MAARLGTFASGFYSQMVSDLGATPSGIRNAGFREAMQVSSPPSVATDAQLGFSLMAYQSTGVPFDRCGEVGHILVRLSGTSARARQGGRMGRHDATGGGGLLFMLRPPNLCCSAPPATLRVSILGTQPMEYHCGGTMAPGRLASLPLRSMRGITAACLPLRIGLPNLWS